MANQNDCQLLKTGARRLDCVTTADLRVRGGNCFQSSVYSSPTYRKNEEKESQHSASLERLRNPGTRHARVLQQLYVKGKFHKQFLKLHVRFWLFIDVLGPFIPSLLRPICMPAIGILMKNYPVSSLRSYCSTKERTVRVGPAHPGCGRAEGCEVEKHEKTSSASQDLPGCKKKGI